MQSISVLNNDHRSSVALACAGLCFRLFKFLAVDKKNFISMRNFTKKLVYSNKLLLLTAACVMRPGFFVIIKWLHPIQPSLNSLGKLPVASVEVELCPKRGCKPQQC